MDILCYRSDKVVELFFFLSNIYRTEIIGSDETLSIESIKDKK